MKDSADRCPGEQIVVAGYSQGAMIAHGELANWGNASKIAGVVMVADPNRDSFYTVTAAFDDYPTVSRTSATTTVIEP